MVLFCTIYTYITMKANARIFHWNGFRVTFLLLKLKEMEGQECSVKGTTHQIISRVNDVT